MNEAGAREWIAANPEAWAYMTRTARFAASRGVRFGMKGLAEHVRWNHILANGVPYKLNNNIVSALARILVEEHPFVAPYLEMRGSVDTFPSKA